MAQNMAEKKWKQLFQLFIPKYLFLITEQFLITKLSSFNNCWTPFQLHCVSDNSNVMHEETILSGSACAHHTKRGVEYEKGITQNILHRNFMENFHEKRRLLDWKSLAEEWDFIE